MAALSKVLITGLEGFTGQHLKTLLSGKDIEVIGLKADITDREAVLSEVLDIAPSHVVHLAAISFAAEANTDLIYRVNVTGTLNLLDALSKCPTAIKKVIIASSATVYGNLPHTVLSEELCPKPVNHYGCSKLSMEHMVQNYNDKMPIVITRPFNYTGIGHAEHFLIPKIIKAYRNKKSFIELGNLDVSREFNDVRDVCNIYYDLLCSKDKSIIVNLCSGKTISLIEVIESMNQLAGYEMDVKVNPEFVRKNEIKDLSGSTIKLNGIIKPHFKYDIDSTLKWMYEGNK